MKRFFAVLVGLVLFGASGCAFLDDFAVFEPTGEGAADAGAQDAGEQDPGKDAGEDAGKDAGEDSAVPDKCDKVNCSGMDSDCTVGECNPDTGKCIATPRNEGDACEGVDLCLLGTTCHDGMCSGGTEKDCSGKDSDCSVGQCNPDTGKCVAEPENEGDSCDDGSLCTTADQCSDGTCAGVDIALDCAAFDEECKAGQCDPDTGACTAVARPLSAICDDGSSCTTSDHCIPDGTCVGANLPSGTVCSDGWECTVGEVCDGAGVCPFGANQTPGVACDDHNECTSNDACDTSGYCVGIADPLQVGTACQGACFSDATCDATGGCVGGTKHAECGYEKHCNNAATWPQHPAEPCATNWYFDNVCDCGCALPDPDCGPYGIAVCDWDNSTIDCGDSWKNDADCDCGCIFSDGSTIDPACYAPAACCTPQTTENCGGGPTPDALAQAVASCVCLHDSYCCQPGAAWNERCVALVTALGCGLCE